MKKRSNSQWKNSHYEDSRGEENKPNSIASSTLPRNKLFKESKSFQDSRGIYKTEHKTSYQKMKIKGNAEDNLGDILAVKAEQIRHRLATELKLNDDIQEFDAVQENPPEFETTHKSDLRRPEELIPETQSQIPLSKARIKRRQLLQDEEINLKGLQEKSSPTVFKTKGNKSTLKIQNYRPGYTWNKGGRIKELRIRCLARKYLFVWRRKVFGRVPLSVALYHYNVSLKRQAFGVWYEFWWEIVKEWRLLVRAECHYRYKLGCVMFKAWREYVLLRKISHKKRDLAISHYNRKQKESLWSHWRFYIQEKQISKELDKRSTEFKCMRIIRSAWSVWKIRLTRVEELREFELEALQFWSYRLQAQHWLIWKRAFSERRRREEQMKNVCMYHNSVLASRCLKAWVIYIDNRRTKKEHKAFASHVYDTQLKVKFFGHWNQCWHLISSVRQHQDRMEEIAETFRLRWAISRWTQYVETCKQMKEKEKIAVDHYHHHLKHFGLASFRLAVVHSRIKEMRIKLSSQLEATQLQRRFWNRWVQVYDQKQEDKIASTTAVAYHCYYFNLMLKSFTAFSEYCQLRKQRKAHYAKADAHFYLCALPKCVFHMKLFVEQEKTCGHNAVTSKCIYKSNMQRRFFTKWRLDARTIRDQRMLHRMAVLHHESVITRSLFYLWKERAVEVEEEKQKMKAAHHHYLYFLCHKVLNGWRAVVLTARGIEINFVKASRYHTRKVEKQCFEFWKQWIEEKKQKKLKTEVATKHRSRHILAMSMKEWKVMWTQGKFFQMSADAFLEKCNQDTLLLAFKEWTIVTKQLALRRKQKVTAAVLFNRCLMLKVVREWRNWAAVKAYQGEQSGQLLHQAITQLQHLKLSLYFKRWQAEKARADEMHKKGERAECHHQQTLQAKALYIWKDFTMSQLRKTLLVGQSQKFNEVCLTAKSFYIWRARWEKKVEENSKTEIALWQWSLVLQRKVLLAWQAFKDHQKHKRQRLLDAASFRRQMLLQQACCQWLTTADSLTQVRASVAARYQTKAVMNSFQLVQKCALHWKTWARRRASAANRNGGKSAEDSAFPVASRARLPTRELEFQNIPSRLVKKNSSPWVDVAQPQLASVSPLRLVSAEGMKSRQRPLPTRPSFLMDSLQRAGLSANLFSDHIDHELGNDEHSNSSNTIADDDDLHVLPSSAEYPSTGRFSPHLHTPSQLAKDRETIHQAQEHTDASFSAEVLSGSNSTLDPSGQEVNQVLSGSNSTFDPSGQGVRRLHLESEPNSSQTSSLSPQLFTPSTQRSQFSGNPLLNSSPVSETGCSKQVTTRTEGRQDFLNFDSGGKMVSGNLGMDYQGSQFWKQQQEEDQKEAGNQKLRGKIAKEEMEAVLLLKPEYFMQKPPAKMGQLQRRKSADDSMKQRTKHTPRTFATWDTSVGGDGMLLDIAREGKGRLRHTPRELASPRRALPPGILHNRASDGDMDVSSLNTARSRGTVTFASPKSLSAEEEIVNIRDRLKQFSQQKQKLRSLQKKYRLLSEWIEEKNKQKKPGVFGDEDHKSATEELDLVRLEVAQLKTIVEGQQPICEKLVQRAQVLADQLNLPF